MRQRTKVEIPKMKRPKPVKISDELADKCDGPNQFENFDALVGDVFAVPHAEIMRRGKKYKKQALANPNKRGPKPKNGASPDLRV